ncbi:DUF3519 domain-containing protein [Helicobacter pylori]|nr:DUF3519 domain-containing protein [Helicobacter pylori]
MDIASGFHKLFKNDAKIAESLKPATTKNLSQGLATTLSGALKYQWTKFTLGTLYRNAPDRILGVKLPKALNEATAGAALKYHIKRALERSHTISDFSKNLELSAQNAKFSNNTLKIIEELTNGVKQASEELSKKASDLQHATTPLKEFGTNYPEFALKPKEALEKLLQERNGQVAGAAYREDLGGIDFVWGTPKTKDSNGYGLAHILERRISNEMKKGLSEAEAKEYALNIVKSIPEVLEKGTKGTDSLGRVFVDYDNKRVGLNNEWKNEKLENHWVISSYELYDTEKQALRSTPQAITKEKAFNSLNSVEPNPTPKPLTDQEDLLKNTELENETTQEAKNLSPLEQANAKKLLKEQHAITPLKEFGKNYPEFALKPKEALEKLLQERNGQVAGATYREDLGGIDFVWGTPKTKDSVGYGLAHVLERREQQALSLGLSEAEAKEYALNIVKSIPEVLEKGTKGTDHLGRVFVDYGNKRVGLNNTWNNKDLENHWVISSYELRDTTEKPTHFPTSQAITKEKDIHSLNSVEPNPTTNALKTQEPLSPLEQANAEKHELTLKTMQKMHKTKHKMKL